MRIKVTMDMEIDDGLIGKTEKKIADELAYALNIEAGGWIMEWHSIKVKEIKGLKKEKR